VYFLIYNIPDRLSIVLKYNRENLGFGAFFAEDMPALWARVYLDISLIAFLIY